MAVNVTITRGYKDPNFLTSLNPQSGYLYYKAGGTGDGSGSGTGVSAHNQLLGVQGGETSQAYHITLDQWHHLTNLVGQMVITSALDWIHSIETDDLILNGNLYFNNAGESSGGHTERFIYWGDTGDQDTYIYEHADDELRIALHDTLLVTMVPAGMTINGTLTLGGGAAVDNIETTLTDDATHIPTSSAVFAAIAVEDIWDRTTDGIITPATSTDPVWLHSDIYLDTNVSVSHLARSIYWGDAADGFDTFIRETSSNYLETFVGDTDDSMLRISDTSLSVGKQDDVSAPPGRFAVNYGNLYFRTSAYPTAPTAALIETSGNLSNGDYRYAIVYVTDEGETGTHTLYSNTVTVDGTHQQIELTNIPVADPSVNCTARKIYRTTAGGNQFILYFAHTINDNSTTSWTDNVADGSLVTSDGFYRKRDDAQVGFYADKGGNESYDRFFYADTFTTIMGRDSGLNLTTANSIVLIGSGAGRDLTTGGSTVAIGYAALLQTTTAANCVAIGYGANYNLSGNDVISIGTYSNRVTGGNAGYQVGIGSYAGGAGNNSVGIGYTALQYFLGVSNVAIGYGSMVGNTTPAENTGTYNTSVGHLSGNDVEAGDYNIFLGAYAGDNVTDGSRNIIIGTQLDASAVDVSYEFRLGSSATILLEGDLTGGNQWIGSNYEARFNILNEYSTDVGVTVDGVLIKDGFVSLDYISPPAGDWQMTLANKQLKFVWVAPTTADGALELEVTGAFTGDVLHIHQHTGNPGAGTHLIHLEADDVDVMPLFVDAAGTISAEFTKAIKTDTINEYTTDAGVTIEGVKIEDSTFVTAAADMSFTDGTTGPHTLSDLIGGGYWDRSSAGVLSPDTAGDDVLLDGGYLYLEENTSRIVFDADLDTYLYSTADDTMVFYTGGGARMAFTNLAVYVTVTFQSDVINEYNTGAGVTIDGIFIKDTEIGIGTTDPQEQLDIRGGTSSVGTILLGRSHATVIGGDFGLGVVYFGGEDVDGAFSNWNAAYINGVADSTWTSATDSPTRLVFATTPDGSGTAVPSMQLASDGVLKIDTITEYTGAAGVTIEGVKIEDSYFETGAPNLSFEDATTGPHTLSDLIASGIPYPGAGIALSTGSAWGTSITNNSANWNTAYSHSQVSSGNPHSVTYAELGGSQPAPIAHASSHLSTGGDSISLFATASTVSGLVPGSNSVGATYYLDGTGSWSVPAGGGGISWNNGGSNRVGTYVDASNIYAEDNLLFDGSTLTLDGDATITGASHQLRILYGNELVFDRGDAGDTFLKCLGSTTYDHGFVLQVSDGGAAETAIDCNPGGGVELYFDGTSRFLTTSNGVRIAGSSTGDANVAMFELYETGGSTRQGLVGFSSNTDDNLRVFADTGKIIIYSTSEAVEIYHAGQKKLQTNLTGAAIVGNSTGDTNEAWMGFYQSNGTTLQGYTGMVSSSNDDMYLAAQTGKVIVNSIASSVDLYNAGILKFRTTSDGVEVTDYMRILNTEDTSAENAWVDYPTALPGIYSLNLSRDDAVYGVNYYNGLLLHSKGASAYNSYAYLGVESLSAADHSSQFNLMLRGTGGNDFETVFSADYTSTYYWKVSSASADVTHEIQQNSNTIAVFGYDDSGAGFQIETGGSFTTTPSIFIGSTNHNVCIGGQTDTAYELLVLGADVVGRFESTTGDATLQIMGNDSGDDALLVLNYAGSGTDGGRLLWQGSSGDGLFLMNGPYTGLEIASTGYIYMPSVHNITNTNYLRYNSTTFEVTWLSSSDIRLKENIKPWKPDSLSFLVQQDLIEFDRKDGSSYGEIGWNANQMSELMPDMTWVDDKGYYNFKDAHFPYHFHRAIKQLNELHETNEQKIQRLENRIIELENQIN